MDFWASAEEADRLWNDPGEKHSAGVTRCCRGAKGSSQGPGTWDCLATESLAKPFLSPCLIFPTWIIKFPHLLKVYLGEIYTKSHIRLHPLHLRMSQALCSQA